MTMNTISSLGSSTAVVAAPSAAVGLIQPGENVSNNSNDPEQPTSDAGVKVGATATSADVQGGTTKNKNEQQPPKISAQDVTDKLNDFMESMNTDLRFQLHSKTGELMVQVVDNKTHKVLREAPSHEYLDLVASLRQYIGAILDKKI